MKHMCCVCCMDDDIDIRKVKEHYEVYRNGKFIFSADTFLEVQHELEQEGHSNE